MHEDREYPSIKTDVRYAMAVRDAEIIRLRFEERWTLGQIADQFHISRQRVHQIVGVSGRLFAAEQAKEKAKILLDQAHEIEQRQQKEFWGQVSKGAKNQCWEWRGSMQTNGYGRFRGISAHRMAYVLENGSIPVGLEIAHVCHNKRCVNPNHLEAMTNKENIGMNKK